MNSLGTKKIDNIIDGKEIAQGIYEGVKNEVAKLRIKPSMVAVLVWKNSPSLRYIKQKEKWAKYTWIGFRLINLEENVDENKLLEVIRKLNNDDTVNGYIVQLPLPKEIKKKNIIDSISPLKDIDWFHPVNQGKVLSWDESWFVSCTPAGVMEIFKSMWVDVAWKMVTVIGRSNIVWKPMISLLLNAWATVVNCNKQTSQWNLEDSTKRSDIVILAAGAPGLLKLDMIGKNTIVIDVWFTVINKKIYWDADFKSIVNNGNPVTPVPGWVWALTVAMLMKNTLKAYQLQNNR
jgi:methylenetetrahydrofolate dehydrogenase (NADP+) / methenyltetrahydrofolate cyclohydrolase